MFELYLVLIVDARSCLICKYKKKDCEFHFITPSNEDLYVGVTTIEELEINLHVHRVVVRKCNHYNCII